VRSNNSSISVIYDVGLLWMSKSTSGIGRFHLTPEGIVDQTVFPLLEKLCAGLYIVSEGGLGRLIGFEVGNLLLKLGYGLLITKYPFGSVFYYGNRTALIV